MDKKKTGIIIRDYRINKNLTQKQLGDMLFVSDKTVSKWECGLGFPEIDLIEPICNILGIDINILLSGETNSKEVSIGNMKNSVFYVCPKCNNIIMSVQNSENMTCCGIKLEKQLPQKEDEKHTVDVSEVEDEWYLSSHHEMTRDHYISFVAFLTGERAEVFKTYPEWDLSLRIPKRSHGKLLWYCTNDGLFYKNI